MSNSNHKISIPTVLSQLWNTKYQTQSKNSVQFFEALHFSSAREIVSTSSARNKLSNYGIITLIKLQTKQLLKMNSRTSQLEERLTQIVEKNVASLGENNRRILDWVSIL
ncbi:Hypothetical_protein [Hexamita inflata]|uniref:Hypothetical_protein n=1 Tax=Hexamita inflata TaxID=28002 RepID=A0AA86REH4_9EUKA|nr:Hypothetical protein HINF_LOCUS33976 [Hexamita inflata]CAI9976934.1 Hypothetical protein HINF_LOCUS64579 [Hexamita inflata]